MKSNRKLSMIALALLLTVGAGQLGVFSAFAQEDTTGTADACVLYGTSDEQVQEPEDAGQDETGEVDAQDAEGEADDAQGEVDDANETAAESASDDQAVYTGSIAVDDASFTGMSSADRCAALGALATITAETAQAAAEAEGTVVTVELDIENGYLVYSVVLQDGRDVKIDAGNGTVLHIDGADDTESGAGLGAE